MTRPTFEVADILRAQGDRFLDRYRSSFDFQQLKAFRAILRCRTAALGGHRDACPNCGHQAISYNSCRNRHCPKCQTQARERWLAARERELLTTSYFHVVFTDVTGDFCTWWNERESTWRKSWPCRSRGTNQSRSRRCCGRSEECRVGKEWRSRWSPYHLIK